MMIHRRISVPFVWWPSLGRFAILVVVLLAVVNLRQPIPAAEPLPPNTVDDFRQFLRTDIDQLGKLQQSRTRVTENLARANEGMKTDSIAFYKKVQESLDARFVKDAASIKARAATLQQQIHTVADAAGVIRLREWQQPDTYKGLDVLDGANPGEMRARVSAKLTAAVKEVVAHGTPQDQAALCALLGEDALYTRTLKKEGDYYYGLLRQQIPQVVALSKKTGPEQRLVREAAAPALARLNAPPAEQIAAVEGLLEQDRDAASRRGAYKALILPFETAAPRILTPSLGITQSVPGEQDAYFRETQTLLGVHANLAMPLLVRGLKDSDQDVRQMSINAWRDILQVLLVTLVPAPRLGRADIEFEGLKLKHQDITGVQPLLEKLAANAAAVNVAAEDPNTSVRQQALAALNDLAECRNRVRGWQALFEQGNKEKELLKPPGQAQKRPDGLPAAFVAQQPPKDITKPLDDKLTPALKQTLNVLSQNLFNPDLAIRLAAVEVLENLGPDARSALPALLRALGDRDKFVRWNVLRILNRFGPIEPATVVPVLIPLICYPDADMAKVLGQTLQRYGPDAAAAVPAMTKAIGVGEPDYRIVYLQTLTFVGVAGTEAIPAIIPLLKFEDPHVRAAAAETLGRFGKYAAKAEPALRAALDDENPDVRKAAGEALLRIGGK